MKQYFMTYPIYRLVKYLFWKRAFISFLTLAVPQNIHMNENCFSIKSIGCSNNLKYFDKIKLESLLLLIVTYKKSYQNCTLRILRDKLPSHACLHHSKFHRLNHGIDKIFEDTVSYPINGYLWTMHLLRYV